MSKFFRNLRLKKIGRQTSSRDYALYNSEVVKCENRIVKAFLQEDVSKYEIVRLYLEYKLTKDALYCRHASISAYVQAEKIQKDLKLIIDRNFRLIINRNTEDKIQYDDVLDKLNRMDFISLRYVSETTLREEVINKLELGKKITLYLTVGEPNPCDPYWLILDVKL